MPVTISLYGSGRVKDKATVVDVQNDLQKRLGWRFSLDAAPAVTVPSVASPSPSSKRPAAAAAAAAAVSKPKPPPPPSRIVSKSMREVESDLAAIFTDKDVDLAKMPCYSDGAAFDALFTSPLFKFQKQGVEWMREREVATRLPRPGDTALFWTAKQHADGKQLVFVIACTNSQTTTHPKFPRGGMLTDEMGCGKTTQTIALLCTDKVDAPTVRRQTLIVCPVSVLHNWQSQIAEHTAKDTLSVHVFHGAKGKLPMKKLQAFDVVLTTYGTLAAAYVKANEKKSRAAAAVQSFADIEAADDAAKKRQRAVIFKMDWHRVVLDESHMIRTRGTKNASAMIALKAERHWCLSGTPLQNKVEDRR
jgi:SWI/SNF-related matrix-associated actin-dependent regulator of chromatin subfamily A3